MMETEIKLRWRSVDEARRAVAAIDARLVIARRLLDDRLFDTTDQSLQRSGRALRLRRDGDKTYLTCKGPTQPGPVKAREEIETTVGDAERMEAALALLGYARGFRSQKYREEYDAPRAHLTIDDTPMGVFTEIEASAEEIAHVAAALGRSRSDYCLDSYSSLWHAWCAERGLAPRDMTFDVRA